MCRDRTPNGVHSILSANDADHSRIRRLLAHAFSDKALHEQQQMLQEYVDLLMRSLRTQAKAKNTINICDWFNYVTFDIIGDLCFGESFDCLRSAAYHPWISILFYYFKSSALVTSTLLLPGMSTILPWAMPKKAIQRRIDHFNTTKAKVHQRLEAGQNKPDFMTYVLRHNDEKGMTIPEIEATFTILAVAGAETTATALTGMINYLVKDRTILAKLTSEIRTTYSNEGQMTTEGLAKMPYLNAVIEEGMRMCPPAPTGSPRIVPAGGETAIVVYAHWSAYRSPKNFHLPESFDPDRWLAHGSSSPYADDVRACFQPFAVGPRNCIGRNLAYLEMRLILARLLWNFDVEAADGKGGPEWRGQKVFLLWEKAPMEVKLTPVRDY
ncbi:hypothetical protein MMC22_000820 [Lobaria immixta]|nr:hypothetical protein [Lobaria immixta]